LIQQSIWLAEERDRERRENGETGGYWSEAMVAEATNLRRQYGKE
jgi:hypothetical protein